MFRSDTPAGLTDHDMSTMGNLGIDTACDLRYGDERVREPSRFLDTTSVEVLELGFDDRPEASFLDSFETQDDAADAARMYLTENYRKYPFMYAPAYRTIIERLADGRKLVVHCTAGKDRAGFAAAIILSALGVDRESVLADYLLTNRYWDRGGREQPGMDAETTAMIFSAREEYIAGAFEAVENAHGSVDAYIRDCVGANAETLAQLRAACLE